MTTEIKNPWGSYTEAVLGILAIVKQTVPMTGVQSRRIAEAAWVGVQVLAFSLSYWFMSVNRAVILWFPLWRQIGEFVESRPRTPQWRTLGWAAVSGGRGEGSAELRMLGIEAG